MIMKRLWILIQQNCAEKPIRKKYEIEPEKGNEKSENLSKIEQRQNYLVASIHHINYTVSQIQSTT